MTELFTRDGQPHNTKHAVHHDGKKAYFIRAKACPRCGGGGRLECFRHVEGGICFKCEGTRTVGDETVYLYTADQLAKLNATAEKKAQAKAVKAQAEQAKRDAEIAARRAQFESDNADVLPWLTEAAIDEHDEIREGFLGDMLRKARSDAFWTEAQAEGVRKVMAQRKADAIKRAGSKHVSEPGQRIEATVTVERENSFERPSFHRSSYYGQHYETVYVTTLRDADGNALVVKSPSFRAEVGKVIKIRGTVKAHNEFRGEAQTLLQRVTQIDTGEAAKAA